MCQFCAKPSGLTYLGTTLPESRAPVGLGSSLGGKGQLNFRQNRPNLCVYEDIPDLHKGGEAVPVHSQKPNTEQHRKTAQGKIERLYYRAKFSPFS